MDCPEASERLPWYLNGSLEARERADVEAHLGGCAACGEELARTRKMSEAFGAHVPMETIVALAAGAGLDAAEDSAARAHLDSCPLCIEDLALARESARAIERAASAASDSRAARYSRWLGALAASVAAAFLAGWLVARPSDRGTDEGRRVAALEAEVAQLRGERERASALQRQVRDLQSPQANVPMLELLPRERASRGTTEPDAPVLRANGAFAALSLAQDSAARYDGHRLELAGPTGDVLWIKDGLVRQPTGDFTALLALSGLREGRYELRLSGRRGADWKPLASYAFDFRLR